jgi:hypothetical protein
MKVSQIYAIVNAMSQEYLGKTDVVNEDLTGIVDFGDQIENLGLLDNYVKSLIDHIGKVVFVDRPYQGSVPSVLMDGWEYGAIMEKIAMDEYPKAQENDTWNLQNGKSYDPNVFNQPKASAKFFNKRSTFEIPISLAEKQVKSAFSNAQQLNSFFSMINTAIETSMTIKLDSLVMSTINSMSAATIKNAESTPTPRAVNLLTLYNTCFTKTLTAAQAIQDPAFLRWASFYMGIYVKRLSKLSTLFNVGGKERFTSADRLHIVLLDEFVKASEAYLQSDTYHENFVKLPNAETVPYWQGSGTDYDFESTSSINVKYQPSQDDASTTPAAVTVAQSGILGVMFDRDALGVSNLDRRTTTNYNPRGEFFNNWYKFDAGYFNDLNENFVVFYVEDVEDAGTGK